VQKASNVPHLATIVVTPGFIGVMMALLGFSMV
jgi:hypothetical protein